MYKVIMLPVAKQDIKEAADWYNSKQEKLGKRFTQHIREKVNLLKKNPFSSVNRYDEVRTAVLDVFPFMIHYLIDEDKKLVVITAILHTSRNPDIWKRNRESSDL
jgi:plasmid stabilization system protein ParE